MGLLYHMMLEGFPSIVGNIDSHAVKFKCIVKSGFPYLEGFHHICKFGFHVSYMPEIPSLKTIPLA